MKISRSIRSWGCFASVRSALRAQSVSVVRSLAKNTSPNEPEPRRFKISKRSLAMSVRIAKRSVTGSRVSDLFSAIIHGHCAHRRASSQQGNKHQQDERFFLEYLFCIAEERDGWRSCMLCHQRTTDWTQEFYSLCCWISHTNNNSNNDDDHNKRVEEKEN